MSQPVDRPAYQPSGQFDAARLPRMLLVLTLAAAGVAGAYYGMLRGDMYLSLISALFPTATAAALTRSVVKSGHCRNPALAGALGAACGLAGYLGYYHLDQCFRWGVPFAAVDRLPGFVAFRLETDHWRNIGKAAVLEPRPPAPGVQPIRRPASANLLTLNGALFGLEALILLGVPLAVGVGAAREPYSERRRRWYSREALLLDPAAGPALRQALDGGVVGAWVEAGPKKVAAHQPHCKVSVWYVPAHEGDEAEVEVYLTPGEGSPLLLSPEEAGAFVQLLPAVRDLAGPSLTKLASEAEEDDDPRSARVRPVPPPYAGRSQHPRNRFLGRCLAWGLMFIPPVLPLAALIGGTCLLHPLCIGPNALPAWVVVAYVLGMGVLCLVFVVRWFNPNGMVPLVASQRFDHWLIRRAVAERPSPLVGADDPQAIFAEMSPRRLWAAGQARCGEYNQGLLRIDVEQKAILFEGDYECYRIPAEAILTCAVEALTGTPATTAGFYAVVLGVRLGSGLWEFPFFPLIGIAGNRWERAVALRERIEALCGRTFGERPAPPPRDRGPVVVG